MIDDYKHVVKFHDTTYTVVVEYDDFWGFQVKECIVENDKGTLKMSERKFIASFSDGQDMVNNALEAASNVIPNHF